MLKFIFIAMVWACIGMSPLHAQEEFIDPPSRPLVTTHFDIFTGGVLVFKALLEGHKDTLNFILDTGSGGISLDSTTVLRMGLVASKPERLIRGIGGIRRVGFIKNQGLQIRDYVIDSLHFHIIDYEVLSALYGRKIDGIVGYSLLSRYIVRINYDTQEMTLCSQGALNYPKGGYLMRPQIKMLPYLSTQVADARTRRFNYLFDLGAGLTVLFSDDFMRDSSFLKSKRKRYLKQGEGLGGRVDMYLTVMKTLKIGPYRFKNIPANIFDDDYNVTAYPSYGGLIGNEIFRRFNIILNYDRQQIYITPNKSFNTPFDYSYSGLELYLIQGLVVTGKIPAGSPAQKAGLLEGDEIIAINNKFGLSLEDLKQTLQLNYGKVHIIYRREGVLNSTILKVVNILKK